MTYKELVEFCYNNDYCTRCNHIEECEAFKRKTYFESPCDFYKLLYSDFDFDAEIEVKE